MLLSALNLATPEHPFLWPLILLIIGLIATGLVGWRMFPFQKKALEDLRDSQQAVIAAKEAHIADMERRFRETAKERDDYRRDLHEERKLHNATTLRLAEVESRPNLATLESLFNSLRTSMDAQSATMNSHIKSDAEIFSAIQTSMAMVPTAMREQAQAFNARQKELLDRIEILFKDGYRKARRGAK